jgi:hypothetical protein
MRDIAPVHQKAVTADITKHANFDIPMESNAFRYRLAYVLAALEGLATRHVVEAGHLRDVHPRVP